MPSNFSMGLQLQKFQDQSEVAHERLSLAQQSALVAQSSQIETAAYHRATLQKQYEQNIAAARTITHLSDLDTTDPNFLKQRAKILASNPEALPSAALQKFMDSQDKDHQAVQASIKNRVAATFSGPAADAWNKAFDSSQNMDVANKIAENMQQQLTRAQKLAVDPNLDPALKSQLFDPQSGQFNTDPALLAKAEVSAGAKAAAAKSGTDAALHLSNINAALKTMSDVPTGLQPDAIAALSPGNKARYDSRYNLEQALKNMSYTAAQASAPASAPVTDGTQPTAPVATQKSPEDELKELLGSQ